jgi:hypothetical protein
MYYTLYSTKIKFVISQLYPKQYIYGTSAGGLLVPDGITTDGYVPLIVNTSRSFPHSWLVTGFITRLTRWMPLVEQELLTLPEHPSSPPIFCGVRVTQSLVLCVCFVDRCLSYCPFSYGHCVVCPSLIYRFWLPLWYLLAIVLSVLLWYTDSDYLPLVSSNSSSINNSTQNKIKLSIYI